MYNLNKSMYIFHLVPTFTPHYIIMVNGLWTCVFESAFVNHLTGK